MEEKFDTIMEVVCDMCHWPYVCCDEEELDNRCLNCQAERKVRAVLEGT